MQERTLSIVLFACLVLNPFILYPFTPVKPDTNKLAAQTIVSESLRAESLKFLKNIELELRTEATFNHGIADLRLIFEHEAFSGNKKLQDGIYKQIEKVYRASSKETHSTSAADVKAIIEKAVECWEDALQQRCLQIWLAEITKKETQEREKQTNATLSALDQEIATRRQEREIREKQADLELLKQQEEEKAAAEELAEAKTQEENHVRRVSPLAKPTSTGKKGSKKVTALASSSAAPGIDNGRTNRVRHEQSARPRLGTKKTSKKKKSVSATTNTDESSLTPVTHRPHRPAAPQPPTDDTRTIDSFAFDLLTTDDDDDLDTL